MDVRLNRWYHEEACAPGQTVEALFLLGWGSAVLGGPPLAGHSLIAVHKCTGVFLANPGHHGIWLQRAPLCCHTLRGF